MTLFLKLKNKLPAFVLALLALGIFVFVLNFKTNKYSFIRAAGEAASYIYPYAHPSPAISYSLPTNVIPNKPAAFSENSTCYDADSNPYLCKNLTSDTCTAAPDYNQDGEKDCYSWWFEIPSGTSNVLQYITTHSPNSLAIGDTSYTYAKAGTYLTALMVCDDIGCCYDKSAISVGSNLLPLWKEVSPF